MPHGRGEFRHIDIVAHSDVVEDRPALDHLVLDQARLLEICGAIRVRHLPLGQMIGQPQRHVAALASEHVEQQAEPFGAARHLVEHDAGPLLGAQNRLGGESDILLPRRALDVAHLPHPLGKLQPLAQVVVGDVGGVGIGRRSVLHVEYPPASAAVLDEPSSGSCQALAIHDIPGHDCSMMFWLFTIDLANCTGKPSAWGAAIAGPWRLRRA